MIERPFAGGEEPVGDAGELTPPGLEITPPPEEEPSTEMPPPLDEGPGFEMPPPLDEGPGLEMPPPLDEPAAEEEPSLEMPAPEDDLPAPPWQEDTGAADVGADEEGRSPFASPDEGAPLPDEELPRPPKMAPKPKRSFAFPFRALMILAVIGAVAFVAYGMWKGSSGSGSGLEPIPEAEEIDAPVMAEGLPIPAIPGLEPLPEKKEPAAPAPAPRSAPPAKPAATPKKAVAKTKPAAPAARGSVYEAALSDYRAGNYEKASQIWKTMLQEKAGTYTVQVVVACQIDTVKNAFSSFGDRKIFTIPLKLSGRTCYRVCYGIFPSKEAAATAIDALPVGLQKDLSIKTAKSII
jgi:hypothetical protein